MFTEHVHHDIKSQVRGFFYWTGTKQFKSLYGDITAKWVFNQKVYIDREKTDVFLQFNCSYVLMNELFEYNTLVDCMVKHTQLIIDKVLVERKFESGTHCSYKNLTYHTTPYALSIDISDVNEMD